MSRVKRNKTKQNTKRQWLRILAFKEQKLDTKKNFQGGILILWVQTSETANAAASREFSNETELGKSVFSAESIEMNVMSKPFHALAFRNFHRSSPS